MKTDQSDSQLDRADALENDRELLGDRLTSVQDFSSEEAGYHKTLKPGQIQMIAVPGSARTNQSIVPLQETDKKA